MKLRPRFELLLTCELCGLDPNQDRSWTDEEMERFVAMRHYVRGLLGLLMLREQLNKRRKHGNS